MPSLALADALHDFGGKPAEARVQPILPELPTLPPAPVVPLIDVDAVVAEAVRLTEETVTSRLTAIYESTLQAERDDHAAAVEALKAELGTRAGDHLAARIAEMEDRLVRSTTTVVARVLAAVTTEDMQRRSIAALANAITGALTDGDALRVRVTGPQSLFESLSNALGPRAEAFEFRESASVDLQVDMDGNLFETRIAEWTSTVSEVIA